MIKVLMVCLGNICRSPLAEGILKSKIDPNKILVDSAGTSNWHIGNLPDERSIGIAKKHDVEIGDQRCRQFHISDFDKFDFIYVMDNSNYKNVVAMAGNELDIQKVKLILDVINPSQNAEVPDPYYEGDDGFEFVFQMLDEACQLIANNLKDNEH